MEEYLQYMKTLRSQMNDVEDQAAKNSVEEQMLVTSIQSLENDLSSAKSETKKLREESEKLNKEKGQVCSRILEMQRKSASLESDSCMLVQSLELIQQERVGLSVKMVEKSAYFTRVAQELQTKLQEQQDWFHSHNHGVGQDEDFLVKDGSREQMREIGGNAGAYHPLTSESMENDSEANESQMVDTHSATAKSDEIRKLKAKQAGEISEIKKCIERMKCRANNFEPGLRGMDVEALEKEREALLSDKAGETEFIQSLRDQVDKLQGISRVVKCGCGEDYKVELDVSV